MNTLVKPYLMSYLGNLNSPISYLVNKHKRMDYEWIIVMYIPDSVQTLFLWTLHVYRILNCFNLYVPITLLCQGFYTPRGISKEEEEEVPIFFQLFSHSVGVFAYFVHSLPIFFVFVVFVFENRPISVR